MATLELFTFLNLIKSCGGAGLFAVCPYYLNMTQLPFCAVKSEREPQSEDGLLGPYPLF